MRKKEIIIDQSVPKSAARKKEFLIVGPLPPPIGGSPLTLKTMLIEFQRYPDMNVTVINTSPHRHVSKKATGFNLEKVRRMFMILKKFRLEIRKTDAVMVFANDLFAFVLVPILLWQAKRHKKPFFLKPVGSGLDLFMESHGSLVKSILVKALRSMDGIFAQTQLLTEYLKKEGCPNSYFLPGFRLYQPLEQVHRSNSNPVRLIYLAHVTRAKGPLVLLDAVKILDSRGGLNFRCDFYGPIHEDVQEDFDASLAAAPSAHYMGVVEAGQGTQKISEYDILVLPTCYDTEGHPGVLIEAMHAGVPIISTQIRTIPELVDHGINGLLVPVGDSLALADAIQQMVLDDNLRKTMAASNYEKGIGFRSNVVVDQMLARIFPDLKPS